MSEVALILVFGTAVVTLTLSPVEYAILFAQAVTTPAPEVLRPPADKSMSSSFISKNLAHLDLLLETSCSLQLLVNVMLDIPTDNTFQ